MHNCIITILIPQRCKWNTHLSEEVCLNLSMHGMRCGREGDTGQCYKNKPRRVACCSYYWCTHQHKSCAATCCRVMLAHKHCAGYHHHPRGMAQRSWQFKSRSKTINVSRCNDGVTFLQYETYPNLYTTQVGHVASHRQTVGHSHQGMNWRRYIYNCDHHSDNHTHETHFEV